MIKTIENIDSAIKIIIDCADNHATASEEGKYRIANKNFDEMQKAYFYLRDNNHLDSLEILLTHPSLNVQVAVASYLLLYDKLSAKAKKILETIAKQEIPHKSFNAKMVLSEWKKGNLKF